MSPTISARCVPRTTALVWWSISSIVTRTVVLVAEHDLAERVADEDQRDAGLVEERGGRVVVGGEHRDALAVGVAAWRCRRRSGGGRSRSGRSSGGLRGGTASLRAGRRGRPAPRPRGRGGGRRPRAWRAAAGRRASRPRARIVTRLVSVPKPEPGSATSLATSRSTPLRRSLSGARSSEPVSAAKPDEDGRRRVERPRGAGRPTSARMSAVGSSSRVRPSPRSSFVSAARRGRKSATAAAMTRASARLPSIDGVEDGVAHLGGRSRRGRPSAPAGSGDLHAAGDERHPGAAGERRLGDRDAHPARWAVADEADRVDRLARCRRRSRRRGGRRGPRSRGGAGGGRSLGGVGLADRPVVDGRDDRVDDPRQLGEPADAGLAGRERPGLRRHDRVAEVAAAAARRWRASPGASTCRRPSPARRRPGRSSRGRWRSRRRPRGRSPSRPSQWAVAGATTIASAVSATTMWPIRPSGSRARTSVSTGWRVSAANVSGPTNRVADGVSMTTTSAPSARRRRSSSTAL